MQAIIDVLTRAYWSRAWIVQEVVLSALPMMVLGSTTVDLHVLVNIVLLITVLEDQELDGIPCRVIETNGAIRLRHFSVCHRWYGDLHDDGDGFHGLVDALELFAFSSDVTDPRDRVYAFFAFQDRDTPPLRADYTISTITAYIKFSAALARNTRSLEYLRLANGSMHPMPTWTVDPSERSVLLGRQTRKTDHIPFKASQGRQHEPSTDLEDVMSRLIVRGRIIDTVGKLSNVTRLKQDTYPMESVKLSQEVDGLATLISEKNQLDEDCIASWTQRIFIALLAFDRGPHPPVKSRPWSVEALLKLYTEYIKTGEHIDNIDVFFTYRFAYVKNDCQRKRLFIGTNKQRRLGFGPTNVRSGDVVCILHGSDVPVLLREQDDGYWFIGQCYFEGWMHGDLVDWEVEEADEMVLI
jgi:hypothetical protein